MAVGRLQGRMVFCRDVKETARTLEDVLGFVRTDDGGNGDVSMRAEIAGHPDATVEYYLHPSAARDKDNLGTFEVDDVDAVALGFMAAGWVVTDGPNETPWGTHEASIRDEDGHELTVCSAQSS